MMGWSRAVMKLYRFIIEKRKGKSETDIGTIQALSESYDHSSPDYIRPLIKDVQKRTGA